MDLIAEMAGTPQLATQVIERGGVDGIVKLIKQDKPNEDVLQIELTKHGLKCLASIAGEL
jgi:hypothetical protein